VGNANKHTANFAKQLILQFVSSSYFSKIQKTILFPVGQHTWTTSQTTILKQLKQYNNVVMGGAIVPGIPLNMAHIPSWMRKQA
jgi:hypothetical protein